MLIYDNSTLKDSIDNNYVALGSFDGLHLGHLSLINKVNELAKKDNGKSMVFTFKNHPRNLLKRDDKVKLIMSNEEKIKILEEKKVDILIFKDFDNDIMKMSPEDFIKWLCENYNIKGIVVGFNFRFGYKNIGDICLLDKLQEKYNYKLYVIEPYIFNGEIISSTRIRNELLNGNVGESFKMLSRPYMLKGMVVHGKKLGRTIGFPTANIDVYDNKIIPAKGVYYTNVEVEGKIFKGITSIGNNPTVKGTKLTIETYILDFNYYIYDKEINLFFIEKIRNEKKFNSLEELKEQLNKDKLYASSNKYILR